MCCRCCMKGSGMSRDVEDDHGQALLESVDVIDGCRVSWTLGAAFLIASSSIQPDVGQFGPGWFGSIVLFVVIFGGLVLYVKFRSGEFGSRAPYTDLSVFHEQQRDREKFCSDQYGHASCFYYHPVQLENLNHLGSNRQISNLFFVVRHD